MYFCLIKKLKSVNNIRSLIPWLGKTSKMVGCFLKDSLQEKGIDLSREQWVVLVKLHTKDGLAQHELAIITERDKTSLTRLVNTMERKKLVSRKITLKDKRVNLIYLTDFGRQEFERAVPVMQRSIEGLQTGLSEKEISNAIHTLQKLQTNLSKLSTTCGTNL